MRYIRFKQIPVAKVFFLLLALFLFTLCYAGRISGTVRDTSGRIIPFATIQVKDFKTGTTANNEGRYELNLPEGSYTLICQHVSYQRAQKLISVTIVDQTLDFVLEPQKFLMQEVIIKRGEDPAYEIIRQTIKKRKSYQDDLDRFHCEVYTKGLMKVRDVKDSWMGIRIDSSEREEITNGLLFLSETFSRYSVDGKKSKVEVTATRVSGQSNGFGLSAPRFASFYENNIQIGSGLNPRGFISPISENALYYYKYKYEGAFFEEGRQVSRISIIPRRKFEPLFYGYINIVEDEWRIHSLNVFLTRESQMQLIDTLRIEQLHLPLEGKWVVKSQVIYPSAKMFAMDIWGSFVNVYSNFDLNPVFPAGYFNATVLKYNDSSNKQPLTFWNDARPLMLQQEEADDYRRKDSIALAHKDPRYLDSLDRKANRVSFGDVLITGKTFGRRRSRYRLFVPSALMVFNYNTVEGANVDLNPVWTKRLDTLPMSRKSLSISPSFRYGFSNRHFNPSGQVRYAYGKKYDNTFFVSGGKTVFQFNNASTLQPLNNTVTTLFYDRNYMKIYEAPFFALRWNGGLAKGLYLTLGAQYQDRMPLENTTDFRFTKNDSLAFTPNFPEELMSANFRRHQAMLFTVGVEWQPGVRFVEFPEHKISIGSPHPVFGIRFTQGVPGILGSDVDYSRWTATVRDNLNMKLAGTFNYRFETGGFLSRINVQVQDFTHFNGNQYKVLGNFLETFQLAPYYRYSNAERFYTKLHAEHHFNGLLTNKIPLFRRLNWYLVAGTNAFYVNRSNYYAEAFAGVENIFKIVRIDFINAYEPGQPVGAGIRIGVGSAFFNRQ
jgi:hypothetical protein